MASPWKQSSLLLLVVLSVALAPAAPHSHEAEGQTSKSLHFPDFRLDQAVEGSTPVPKPTIIDRLMPVDRFSTARNTTSVIERVLLHFSSAITVQPNDPHNAQTVIDIYTTAGVSAHYLIDREGHIFRLIPEERAAWHAGRGTLQTSPTRTNGLNQYSIGIEMLAIGSARDMRPYMSPSRHAEIAAAHPEWIGYTDAQYDALRSLLVDIVKRHPAVLPDRAHILGHMEYAVGKKTDPGEIFDYTRIGLPQVGPFSQPVESIPTATSTASSTTTPLPSATPSAQ